MLEEYYRKILFMLHLIVETGRKKCRFVVLSFLIEKKKKKIVVSQKVIR